MAQDSHNIVLSKFVDLIVPNRLGLTSVFALSKAVDLIHPRHHGGASIQL